VDFSLDPISHAQYDGSFAWMHCKTVRCSLCNYLAASVYLHVNPFWNGKYPREFQHGDNVTTTCKDGYLFAGPGFFLTFLMVRHC